MIGGRPPIPAVHTDFPLAALGEELGLIGVLAILGLYLVDRRARAAHRRRGGRRVPGAARRPGLALVVGVQAFIIAAGNLKVLPLTGVTLPFISYGGSSLLANAVVIGLLLALSDKGVEPPPPPRDRLATLAAADSRRGGRPDARRSARRRRPLGRTIVHVAHRPRARRSRRWPAAPATGRSSTRPSSSDSPDDPAVIAAARTVPRGQILDRDGDVLADNESDANGERYRVYAGRAISQVVGYASRRYGHGRPRARLQRRADRPRRRSAGRRAAQVRRRPVRPAGPRPCRCPATSSSAAVTRARRAGRGAVVMLDPATGEVLALASTPTYDASAIAEPGDRRARRSRRSGTTRTSRCCRARRWAATCRARCSRS